MFPLLLDAKVLGEGPQGTDDPAGGRWVGMELRQLSFQLKL